MNKINGLGIIMGNVPTFPTFPAPLSGSEADTGEIKKVQLCWFRLAA